MKKLLKKIVEYVAQGYVLELRSSEQPDKYESSTSTNISESMRMKIYMLTKLDFNIKP